MTESELRSLISRSQKDGFRALFQKYYGYVYAIVWNHIRQVGTHEDAEECACDVFTAIFQHFDRIGEGKLQSYIRTVSKRKSIDCFRRLSAKPPSESIDGQEIAMVASAEDVEQDCETAALRQILLDKIKLLGEPDATIIIMKYYYDCKPDEIAGKVHLTQAAVRKRLSRAIQRLQALLAEDGFTM